MRYLLICFLFLFVFLTNFFIGSYLAKDNSLIIDKAEKTSHFKAVNLSPVVEPEISLVFTGDIIPARSVNNTMVRLNDFTYPFAKTGDFLSQADLTIINLEAPLIDHCPVTDTGMVFCGDKRFLEGLLFSGVDVATLANNHSTNYGQDGLEQTVALLTENNILTVGLDNIGYKEIKGIRFAFLGFNGVSPLEAGVSVIDEQEIKEKVKQAAEAADFVVLLFHFGKEYSFQPVADGQIAPFDPIKISRFAIDQGADLVVGNHPHVVQGYEKHQNKFIFYALGNFIFDQMWSEETRIGAVLKLNLLGSQVNSFSLHPVIIENYSQPVFLEGEEKEKVLEKITPL